MNIRQIDYQQYEQEINRFSLPAASAEYVEFCQKYWQAEPIFIGGFNNGGLAAVLPLYKRRENGLIIIEAAVKTYAEILNLKDNVAINPVQFINFAKNNFKCDVLDLSLCFITRDNFDFSSVAGTFACVTEIKQRDPEKVLVETVNKKSRNQIRLAQKNGLKKEHGGDVEKFYPLYRTAMQRLGAIPKEKKYFYDLKSAFGDNFHILIALKDGKTAGANLWIVKNQYLSLMFNVSNKEYWNICVNNFLYWEMISWGLKNNIRWFDFGINASRDKEQIHFKKSYGARAYPVHHSVKLNSARARASYFLRKLKFLIKIILKEINCYGKQ